MNGDVAANMLAYQALRLMLQERYRNERELRSAGLVEVLNFWSRRGWRGGIRHVQDQGMAGVQGPRQPVRRDNEGMNTLYREQRTAR